MGGRENYVSWKKGVARPESLGTYALEVYQYIKKTYKNLSTQHEKCDVSVSTLIYNVINK